MMITVDFELCDNFVSAVKTMLSNLSFLCAGVTYAAFLSLLNAVLYEDCRIIYLFTPTHTHTDVCRPRAQVQVKIYSLYIYV